MTKHTAPRRKPRLGLFSRWKESEPLPYGVTYSSPPDVCIGQSIIRRWRLYIHIPHVVITILWSKQFKLESEVDTYE